MVPLSLRSECSVMRSPSYSPGSLSATGINRPVYILRRPVYTTSCKTTRPRSGKGLISHPSGLITGSTLRQRLTSHRYRMHVRLRTGAPGGSFSEDQYKQGVEAHGEVADAPGGSSAENNSEVRTSAFCYRVSSALTEYLSSIDLQGLSTDVVLILFSAHVRR
eukprot:3014957-Pyramimonas_sp.AAC.1